MSLQRNAFAVGGFQLAMRLGAWLQRAAGNLVPPPFRLIQMGSAFWLSRALHAAARLDVATLLGGEALAVESLARRLDVSADALARLLRLLAASGVFCECAPGVFRNSPVSSYLRRDHASSVRAMVLLHNTGAMSEPWYRQLEAGIRRGVPPFVLSHGRTLFEHLDEDAELDALFSSAMDSVEALAGDSFATDLDWSRFRRVIDVGGSRGRKSLALLHRHAHLEALVVDRPQVIAEAGRYWHESSEPGLERLQFMAGDLLDNLPGAKDSHDVYLLSAVLHGFDDATCIRAFDSLRQAIGQSGARVILMEMVVPEDRADLASALCDMQMFMGGYGRERTLREWHALCHSGGMEVEQVVDTRSLAKLLVLRPGLAEGAVNRGARHRPSGFRPPASIFQIRTDSDSGRLARPEHRCETLPG
ncbi:methyltransferase [Pseudomonas sp. zfem005]|uniref:methyltransferase n=1 Tax=Pseudomonas sp. zfem005 TaxID=3078200 RepID=UPI002928DE2D|nr:methyltransferase [Pseudomonas sp. zfem005]MDU9414389.1 methyltransferase [Pseudomonas sp. zfem005]